MPLERFVTTLESQVAEIRAAGTAKGDEAVVVRVDGPSEGHGPRFYLEGAGDKPFLRMNSNSYLGLSLREDLIAAEEAGAKAFGVGPGAVRFISGTYAPHISLEKALAEFHGREACMLTSAAYTSVLGVIVSLTTPETIILSDELNHNCIINAMRLARPKGKKVFPHLDVATLEAQIQACIGECENLLVVTDGVFSMRGDYAPLKEMSAVVKKYNHEFPRDIVLIVDDSHGVGAYGATGGGTEEIAGADGVDILVATLGKAFGVNGGYVVTHKAIVDYLREKSSFYIYTNPITPAEAVAAQRSLEILQSDEGAQLLSHLAAMTQRFEDGLVALGYETISSPHPVVPLMVRDTDRTTLLVAFLRENGVLATGLNYPVVPKGDQAIRFQVCADHTPSDIDFVLGVLEAFKQAEA